MMMATVGMVETATATVTAMVTATVMVTAMMLLDDNDEATSTKRH